MKPVEFDDLLLEPDGTIFTLAIAGIGLPIESQLLIKTDTVRPDIVGLHALFGVPHFAPSVKCRLWHGLREDELREIRKDSLGGDVVAIVYDSDDIAEMKEKLKFLG